eukprot:scaffold1916_cov123-Isochrysis_galbana.AAC.5
MTHPGQRPTAAILAARRPLAALAHVLYHELAARRAHFPHDVRLGVERLAPAVRHALDHNACTEEAGRYSAMVCRSRARDADAFSSDAACAPVDTARWRSGSGHDRGCRHLWEHEAPRCDKNPAFSLP